MGLRRRRLQHADTIQIFSALVTHPRSVFLLLLSGCHVISHWPHGSLHLFRKATSLARWDHLACHSIGVWVPSDSPDWSVSIEILPDQKTRCLRTIDLGWPDVRPPWILVWSLSRTVTTHKRSKENGFSKKIWIVYVMYICIGAADFLDFLRLVEGIELFCLKRVKTGHTTTSYGWLVSIDCAYYIHCTCHMRKISLARARTYVHTIFVCANDSALGLQYVVQLSMIAFMLTCMYT